MQGLSFTSIPTRAFDDISATYFYLSNGGISNIEATAFNDFQVAVL